MSRKAVVRAARWLPPPNLVDGREQSDRMRRVQAEHEEHELGEDEHAGKPGERQDAGDHRRGGEHDATATA